MMRIGTYRNHLGAELTVTEPVMEVGYFRTLGLIWKAEARDTIFGNEHYLVTDESLEQSGYELIEDGAE